MCLEKDTVDLSLLLLYRVSLFPRLIGFFGKKHEQCLMLPTNKIHTQTRYRNRLGKQCIFLAVSEHNIYFCVTNCRTDSGKYCTAGLLSMKIKFLKHGRYCHVCFENYFCIEHGSTFVHRNND